MAGNTGGIGRIAAATVTIAVLTASGCSPETVVERAVERQTDGEVDVDFSGGNFRIETEEGILEYSSDGTFRLVTEDGEVITGTVDGDGGFQVMGPDGEMITGSVDGDGGFQVMGPDGEIATSQDGQVVVTGDDGTAEFGTSGELPADFPSAIPLPHGFEPESSSRIVQGDQASFTVVGPVDGSVADVATAYRTAVAAAGFEITSEFSAGEVSGFVGETSDWTVSATAVDDSGTTQLSLVVVTTS